MNSWGRPGRSMFATKRVMPASGGCFCRFDSKYVEGRPGGYRLLVGASKQTRRQRKEELQASLGTNKPVVVACQLPSPELAELIKIVVSLRMTARRKSAALFTRRQIFTWPGKKKAPGGCLESWRRAVSRLRRQKARQDASCKGCQAAVLPVSLRKKTFMMHFCRPKKNC